MDLSDVENWMGKNLPLLGRLPLNRLSIPGSHDAFTSAITATSKLADGRAAGPHHKLVRTLIRNLARTQRLPIGDQLRCGVRYFDMRVCRVRGDFWTHHFLVATRLSDDLAAVAQFVETHPAEIVVLDFSHFMGMDEDEHVALSLLVDHALGHHLISRRTPVTDSVASILAGGKRVLLLYEALKPPTAHANIWYDDIRSKRFANPWYQLKSTDEVIEQFCETGATRDRLFVSQAIISPPETVGGFLGYLKAYRNPLRAAAKVNPRVAEAIASGRWASQNIVMVDDVSTGGVIEAVLNSIPLRVAEFDAGVELPRQEVPVGKVLEESPLDNIDVVAHVAEAPEIVEAVCSLAGSASEQSEQKSSSDESAEPTEPTPPSAVETFT